MSQNIIALCVIGFFMIFPLAIGFIAQRKASGSAEDYFIQSRSMGPVAVFFSVAATWWSAFAFLGSNGYFYTSGPLYWTAIAWNVLFGILYFGVGKKIWYFGKLNGYVTATDFFKHQYGSVGLGNLIAIIMIVGTVPYLQVQLSGGAYLIQVASGDLIPFAVAALLFYLVIIIYVWAGGIRAIAWCDIFYGVLLFFGMIFAGLYVASLVGGPAAMFRTVEEMFPGHTVLQDGAWMKWLTMFIITPIGSFMGPQLWARFYATSSPKTFDMMPFLLALAAIAYVGSCLTGNAGKVIYPDVAELINSNADYILPTVLFNNAPFVLGSVLHGLWRCGGNVNSECTGAGNIDCIHHGSPQTLYQQEHVRKKNHLGWAYRSACILGNGIYHVSVCSRSAGIHRSGNIGIYSTGNGANMRRTLLETFLCSGSCSRSSCRWWHQCRVRTWLDDSSGAICQRRSRIACIPVQHSGICYRVACYETKTAEAYG